jgi:hypothetical protein
MSNEIINDLEELWEIIDGRHDDFYTLQEVDRLYTGHFLNYDAEMIALDKVQGRAFRLTWVECQDYGPDFSTLDVTEVKPVTVTVTTWETVERFSFKDIEE